VNEQEARNTIVTALHKTANVFNNPSISDRLQDPYSNVTMADLQLDSLDMVEWGLEIEAQTGLTIDPAELNSARTLDDVVKVVVEKLAVSAA
jgi:acyl carrier protein